MTEDGELTFCDMELQKPRPDEVLVKIVACGICHTDIMMQHHSSQYPFLLGHEGSGIVAETGSKVEDITKGDAVIISYTSCGHCRACREKRPYECASLYNPFFLGYREDGTSQVSLNGREVPALIRQGAFAEYVLVHRSRIGLELSKTGKRFFYCYFRTWSSGIRSSCSGKTSRLQTNHSCRQNI